MPIALDESARPVQRQDVIAGQPVPVLEAAPARQGSAANAASAHALSPRVGPRLPPKGTAPMGRGARVGVTRDLPRAR